MRQLAVIAGLILGCAWTVPALALAPQLEESTNTEAAATFFYEVLEETKNPVIAALIQENLLKLNASAATQAKRYVEVPVLKHVHNGLAIPAVVNGSVMSNFVVDTGATYTVITPQLARTLGVSSTSSTAYKTIATANGIVRAPIVTLGSVNIGGVEVSGIQVVIMDLGPNTMVSGLLGMNFFKDMDLTIKPGKIILGVNPD